MDEKKLLVELGRELKRGGIYEAHIVAEDEHVDGVCHKGGTIVVNPAPAVVDTLLHELLHRRFPDWSEARVSNTAFNLVRGMSHARVRRWYRKYQQAAQKCERPVMLE